MMVKYKTTQRLTKEVINEILKIQKDKGLTPEEIVKVAKPKDNPLHDLFEWDNKIASDQWRLQQARVIVNEVKVVAPGPLPPDATPAVVSVFRMISVVWSARTPISISLTLPYISIWRPNIS